MFEQLDFESPVPIYTQIEKQVRFGIASGRLKSGDPLPSAKELAERFGVNVNTVMKAYRDLRIMGCVIPQRTVGVFIAKDCSDTLKPAKANTEAMDVRECV